MLDTGCWILDAGYWMLDTGCWILVTGYWILDAGCIKKAHGMRHSAQG
ncbi:MAG: phosphotransferase [Deltaproteobacteria bacterium]|nr:phosphotransferase [Deltaproteobacteria bacterium]